MQNKKAYFEEVYETYVKQIFRFVYLRVTNIHVSEDVTSETFLRFWKAIEKGKKIDNVRALLYVIARGIIIDFYRSKKHTQEVALTLIEEENLSDVDSEDMLHVAHMNQQLSKIYETITQLKKEYQEVLLLRFVEDLDYGEIATILNKKESSVRVLLHRALTTLKERV